MKICFINNLFRPYIRGGAERVIELLAEQCLKQNHTPCVITTRPYGQIPADGLIGFRCYYLPSLVYRLSTIPKVFRFFYHFYNLFDFINAWRVKRILTREKCDIVITNNLIGLSFLIPFLLKIYGIKHIHILHDIQLLHPSGLMFYGREAIIDTFPARVYQSICRTLFRFCSTVIAPSRWLMSLHEHKGFFAQAKRMVKFNPVVIEKTSIIRKEDETAKFKFLYVGLVERHKGVRLMVEAFKIFSEKNRKLEPELYIIGDGFELETIKKFTGEGKGIRFSNRLNNEKVIENMINADCLIVPSLCYENSPTVIYEAAFCHLPVLAADIGGMTELTAHFGGILFRPGDKDDLIKKMQWIVENAAALKTRNEKDNVKRLEELCRAADNYLLEIIG